jgi:hypothetical protein
MKCPESQTYLKFIYNQRKKNIGGRKILNCKFNGVQNGIATEAATADELSEAKFRLAGA